MGERHLFETCHPALLFGYFAAVALTGMLLLHPVYTVLSFCGGAAVCICFCGAKKAGRMLGAACLFALFVALLNPLVNHRGVWVLFYLWDNPVTMEAVLYGICSGLMMVAVCLWLWSAGRVLTGEKMLYLFAGVTPSISIMVAMVRKLLPEMLHKARMARAARAGLDGPDGQKAARDKLREGLLLSSVLLEWSMEDGLDTAASMRARGYGAVKKRSSYSSYCWRASDTGWAIAALLLWLGALLCWGIEERFAFFPRLRAGGLWTGTAWLGYLCYVMFLLLPLWMGFVTRVTAKCRRQRRITDAT